MASDRTIYDQGAYLTKTKESLKPLNYMLQINAHESCEVCGDTPNVSKHDDRVDVENDLFGLNRKLTRDPRQEYQKDPKIAKQLNYTPPYLCERNISHASFLTKSNPNQYMEDLKTTSISQMKEFENK